MEEHSNAAAWEVRMWGGSFSVDASNDGKETGEQVLLACSVRGLEGVSSQQHLLLLTPSAMELFELPGSESGQAEGEAAESIRGAAGLRIGLHQLRSLEADGSRLALAFVHTMPALPPQRSAAAAGVDELTASVQRQLMVQQGSEQRMVLATEAQEAAAECVAVAEAARQRVAAAMRWLGSGLPMPLDIRLCLVELERAAAPAGEAEHRIVAQDVAWGSALQLPASWIAACTGDKGKQAAGALGSSGVALKVHVQTPLGMGSVRITADTVARHMDDSGLLDQCFFSMPLQSRDGVMEYRSKFSVSSAQLHVSVRKLSAAEAQQEMEASGTAGARLLEPADLDRFGLPAADSLPPPLVMLAFVFAVAAVMAQHLLWKLGYEVPRPPSLPDIAALVSLVSVLLSMAGMFFSSGAAPRPVPLPEQPIWMLFLHDADVRQVEVLESRQAGTVEQAGAVSRHTVVHGAEPAAGGEQRAARRPLSMQRAVSQRVSYMQSSFGGESLVERYLAACKGDETEAQSRLEATRAWRLQLQLDTVLQCPQPHFCALKAAYPHGFAGRTRDGCVVWVEQFGSMRALAEAAAQLHLGTPDLLQHMAFCLEFCYTQLDARPMPDGRLYRILDLAGLKLSDATDSALMKLTRTILSQLGEHYPERTQRMVIVNVPLWFSTLWRTVVPLLPKATLQKMAIFSNITAAGKALLKDIAEEQLPATYGGRREGGAFACPEEEGLFAYVDSLNKSLPDAS